MVLAAWGLIAFYSSFISLFTGWITCFKVPRAAQANIMISGAVGCIGLAVALFVLVTLVPLGMIAAASRESMEAIETMIKVLPWLIQIAIMAGFTFFGFFLGNIGRFYDDRQLPQLAVGYAVFQGAFAVWSILSTFVLTENTGVVIELKLAILGLGTVANYGMLIYMVQRTLKLVRSAIAGVGRRRQRRH